MTISIIDPERCVAYTVAAPYTDDADNREACDPFAGRAPFCRDGITCCSDFVPIAIAGALVASLESPAEDS